MFSHWLDAGKPSFNTVAAQNQYFQTLHYYCCCRCTQVYVLSVLYLCVHACMDACMLHNNDDHLNLCTDWTHSIVEGCCMLLHTDMNLSCIVLG